MTITYFVVNVVWPSAMLAMVVVYYWCRERS